jgi:uncharacterized protein YllA (UPF0747 family)
LRYLSGALDRCILDCVFRFAHETVWTEPVLDRVDRLAHLEAGLVDAGAEFVERG